MSVPERGLIRLNGNDYRIDPRSWRGRDIVDFAPRASTPGGSIIHSELGLYQVLLQTDWKHGFGWQWYADASGYLRTDGQVDTRHSGVAMLMTQLTTETVSGTPQFEGFTVFNGNVWAWGDNGLYEQTAADTWSARYTANAVNFALPVGDYLVYAPDGARVRKVTTGGTHSDAGVDANATDYLWFLIHNGYIYAGKDASRLVFYDSNDDLSDLHGTQASDSNEIVVGAGTIPTIGAISYQGKLIIFRQDGAWMLGGADADDVARRLLDFADQISSTNFRSAAIHNGFLVFPVRDNVYQWNGSRLTDITPPRVSDDFPYVTYGRFDNFVNVGRFLFCTARTSESTYEEHLLAYDGVAWFKLAELITDGSGEISAMDFDPINNYLWIHEDDTAQTTKYIQFQDFSEFPYANFPTSGTHSLVTSRLDMGFRRVTKSLPSILVEASNVNGSGRHLLVYYSIDGGAWTAWGDNDGTTNKITAEGVTELSDPTGDGTGDTTLEFNYIKFRVDFVTGTTTETPVLEGLTTRFLIRPNTLYGYVFDIIAASELETGMFTDARTGKEIMDDLHTARASAAPITLVDMFGTEIIGYVSAINENVVERHEEHEKGYPNIEQVIRVTFVQVG